MKRIIHWIKDPRHLIPGFVVGGIVGLGAICAWWVYDYTEHNPRFCLSCHIMQEPFEKWEKGTHGMVNCHSCHQQSKMDSLHQLWMYVTQKPKEVVHHPKLDHTVCAKCHMNNTQRWHDVSETAGHKIHFERAQIECLDCHGQGIHNIARPENVCIKCHEDRVDKKNKMVFVHCTQCHNFLAKEGGEAGIKPTREKCLDCHQKVKVGHVTFPENAPMQFECVDCHKPHGKMFLKSEDCLACHGKLSSPPHGPDEKSRCMDCHKPHSWKAVKGQ